MINVEKDALNETRARCALGSHTLDALEDRVVAVLVPHFGQPSFEGLEARNVISELQL